VKTCFVFCRIVFDALRQAIEQRESQEKKFFDAGFSNPSTYKQRQCFGGLEKELQDYITTVPVVGFNSQRYDLNVIKGALMKRLEMEEDPVGFVVKKTDALTCVKTTCLKFVDICNFIAPGFSYSDYLRAYGVEETKGFFPYEWLDTLDKLDYKELPCREAFSSKLKRTELSEKDYETVKNVWQKEKMSSVRDLLVWYNNLDVKPFLEALEKQSAIYKEKGIDMLKDGISLPGLAVIWLFSVIEKPFSLKENFTTALRRMTINYGHCWPGRHRPDVTDINQVHRNRSAPRLTLMQRDFAPILSKGLSD
jgi:hypothetical protein